MYERYMNENNTKNSRAEHRQHKDNSKQAIKHLDRLMDDEGERCESTGVQ